MDLLLDEITFQEDKEKGGNENNSAAVPRHLLKKCPEALCHFDWKHNSAKSGKVCVGIK